jgi:hypothetical protein
MGQITNGSDAPIADADIGMLHPPRHYGMAALKSEVETRHDNFLRNTARPFCTKQRASSNRGWEYSA